MPLFSTPLRVAFRRPWPGTRRGLVLWLMCVAIIVIGGANYIGTQLPERSERALAPLLGVMPSTEWGWLFVAVGLVSAFLSYCHYDRDHIGYALMVALTAFWGTAWVTGFIADWLDRREADWRILGGATVWLVLALILFVCRGFDKTPLGRN